MNQGSRGPYGSARMFALALVLFVLCKPGATAVAQQQRGEDGEPLVLAMVVESDDGLKLARRVRTLVSHHLHMDAQPLTMLDSRGERPDVVIAVSAGHNDALHVVYWDRTGIADGLVAPQPKAVASTALVAASLAVALARRNMPALQRVLQVDPYYDHSPSFGVRSNSALSVLSPRELRRFLNSLGVVSHRTEGLSEADF